MEALESTGRGRNEEREGEVSELDLNPEDLEAIALLYD